VHSVESFTAVDGHGVRAIVFLQGCNKRCVFCCNPDSWSPSSGKTMTVSQVFQPLLPKLGYYKKSGGGVTISGGEPLLQPRFCKALCLRAKELGLNAAIDTAAAGVERQWNDLLLAVDIALVCVKSPDPAKHEKITGSHDTRPHRVMLAFLDACEAFRVTTWLRYVLMSDGSDGDASASEDKRVKRENAVNASGRETKTKPRKDFRDVATDSDAEVLSVARLAKRHANVAGVELLPYHTFGAYKWRTMGLEYPLSEMKPPSVTTVKRVKRLLESEGVRVVT
jgi:pyruvate-formate lyase-activating enzyme